MPKKKVEVYDKDKLIYPFIENDHVTFSNGMKVSEMLDQGISMPTITHNETSFKVGVGDSDVSSSVVDSAVNMTIKGQTYQNILPDPTLRNEMQGKSMQRLNEGYDSIETVDGVSKSAILKGQTLVNLCPDSIYTNQGWSGDLYKKFNDFPLLIKGRKYTIYAPIGDKTGNPGDAVVNLFVKNGETNTKVYNTFSNGHDTIHKTFVMGDALEFENFTVTGEGFKRNYPNVMIIEGEWALHEMPNYFEGMASCKMPVLQTYDGNIMRLSPPQHTTNNVTIEKINDIEFLFNQGSRQGMGGWKWSIPNREAFTLSFDYEKVSGCENQCQVSVACAGGVSDKFDLSEQFGYFEKTFYVRRTTPTVVEFKPVGELTSTKSVLKISNLKWYIGNKVYSDKTNILHTPEEVVLKGLGDVQDTLNVNTGEYVQRVKEVIYTGEEDGWSSSQMLETPKNISFYIPLDNHLDNTNNPTMRELVKDSLGFTNNCRSVTVNEPSLDGKKGFSIHNNGNVYFTIPTSECANLDAWKSRLRTQPLVLQYPVKNPIIKTVDLSSHGNWEKLVLDGSENWLLESGFNHKSLIEFKYAVGNDNLVSVISDRFATGGDDVERIACNRWGIYIRILKSKVNTVDEFKQWLSQNPTTVWYQTTTTQDNSIREMLSFANGHLQVSSEAENSLLPSVQYEIPTKNSYHMDLMKANTTYTMKAKSVSGTFTIDGTSYNVNANGTFTSPSSMTDKLLIMSNKTNEEVMLLEGNVIDKTIPYFKEIKSAFEGEEEIEIASIGGHNLYDYNLVNKEIKNILINIEKMSHVYFSTIKDNGKRLVNANIKDSDYQTIHTLPSNVKTYGMDGHEAILTLPHGAVWLELQGECFALKDVNHEYTKSFIVRGCPKDEVSKIPLLSPLRSLPNGVCDELIIDRLNHKAKLIQRIGYEVLNENTAFSSYPKMEKEKTLLFQAQNANPQGASTYCISDQFIHRNNLWDSSDSDTEAIMIGGGEGNIGKCIDFRISKAKVSTNNVTILQDYLSKEPITVLYQLNIPIITEIDLEGYPYAYKDGHIFLNSDVAPTTQITYSINQAHQIESANENLQRHEKEISRLQKLIAQYIQVEYESTLLSLKL